MKLVPIRNQKNLFRHPKTNTIYFRMYREGRGRIERSTGTDVVARAVVIADEIRAKFLNEEPLLGKLKKVFQDEWADFLEGQKNKAKRTYASIEGVGRISLLPFFGEYFVGEIDEMLWEKFVSTVRESRPKFKFFNSRKYLKMFLLHQSRLGRIKRLPEFRDPDPETKAGKIYTTDEVSRLLEKAAEDLNIQILCAVTMGMRRGEIMSLEWWQIDLERRTIYLPAEKTKIRRERTFGISDATYPLFKSRLEKHEGPVFPSPVDPAKWVNDNQTAWENCRRNAKVSGRFHDLRHTFLTWAFKKYSNSALICNYAGLSLEEAERTYLHFTPDDTRPVAGLIQHKFIAGKLGESD